MLSAVSLSPERASSLWPVIFKAVEQGVPPCGFECRSWRGWGGVETDVHFRGLLRLALHAQSIGRDTWVLGVAEHQEADDEGEDCQNAIHGVSCTSIAIKAL
jgi:hypothetical protein